MRLSCTAVEIWRLEDNGITTLTFWGHVTDDEAPASQKRVHQHALARDNAFWL